MHDMADYEIIIKSIKTSSNQYCSKFRQYFAIRIKQITATL